MANVSTQLHLLAASSVFSLLPWALFLVLVVLITLVHGNATIRCGVDACKKTLNNLTERSDRARVADAKTPLDVGKLSLQSPAPASAIDLEVERERVQALEARLDFLRESCKIAITQKNDMLAQKNDLLAQRNEDLATLRAQLAAAHQTKEEVLAEKGASCRSILAQKNEEIASRNAELSQKNDELATLKDRIAAAKQTTAAIATARDDAVARMRTVVEELEETRADYADKVVSLTTQATDAENNAAALRTIIQQQKTKINDVLFKNDDLNAELTRVRDLYDSRLESSRIQESNDARTIAQQGVEIAMLIKRLEAAPRQRAAPASPRYSFQSFMSRRSSESDSDSSFDSAKQSPPRWRRFTIRRARKGDKP